MKLHDGAAEPNPVTRDDPHVCRFHVHAVDFDAGQTLTFEVMAWSPSGQGATMLTGMITADADGAGRAPVAGAYSLPDGHYKLIVHTGAGGDKQKVFWVRCATTKASTTSASATTAAPGTTAAMPSTSAATPTTMAAASSSQAPTSTSAEAASATLTSTPSTQAGGGLPFTGTPAIPLLVAALALLAVGASILFGFRRRASQR